ncbi:hypothetical protein ACTG2E_18185 [Aeromonas veronii]
MKASKNNTGIGCDKIHAIWLGDRLPPLAHVCIDDWSKQGYEYKIWLDCDPKIKDWIAGCEFSRLL